MSSEREAPVWLATREEDGEVIFRIGRIGNKLIAQWPLLCTLVSEPDGSAWSLEPLPDAEPLSMEKVRRGAAHALVESLKGRLSLHAGAVSMHGRAVVLLGRNHAGKSTAIAELCSRGGALLADDIALFEERDGAVVVVPTEVHHWLDEGSRSLLGLHGAGQSGPSDEPDKISVGAVRVATAPAPLAAFVSLEYGDGPPRLTRTSGLSVLAELIPAVVRFIVDEPARQRLEIAALTRLAAEVPFYRLTRPSDLRRVHEGGRLLEGLLLHQGDH